MSCPGTRRTASSGAVHEQRPDSSAAMIEYGHPGIVWRTPSQRHGRCACARCGEHSASGRGHGVTSTANRICPSPPRGNTRPANALRSRSTSIRPSASAAYVDP
ncbi:MAG TPA: hypothetical protein VFX70_12620 [Mycobacteriales bacterium]|nr:hypothetical protein [Mycobacteriales bacterium]